MVDRSRRNLLGSLGVGLAACLAGCGAGDPADETATPTPSETEGSPASSRPSGERSETGRPTTSVSTPEPSETPTRTETSTNATTSLSDLERRVADTAKPLRDSMVLVRTSPNDVAGTAWFLRPNLLVTAPTHLQRGIASVETVDGKTLSTTTVGHTDPGGSGAVGALRTDTPGTPIPVGDPSDLATGTVVAQLVYDPRSAEWVPSYGRVQSWTENRERFVTNTSWIDLGGPTVTLDGRVVGMAVGYEYDRTTPPEGAPEPTEPTVSTDYTDWYRPSYEPVTDVVEAVDSLTS